MVDFLNNYAITVIIGVIVLLVVKEIYMFADRKRMENKINKICSRVETLFQWHSVEDRNGVKIWYVREELYTDALYELKLVIIKNTEVLSALLNEIKVMVKVADRESKHN